MEPLRYRSTVWTIAVVDIILSSITLGWSLLFIGAMIINPNAFAEGVAESKLQELPQQDTQGGTEVIKHLKTILWIAVVIQIAVCLLQTVAAIKLLNSSKPDNSPTESLLLCRFWRRVTVFFTVLMCINLFCGSERSPWYTRLFTASNVIMRLIFIYYVQQFMRELHTVPIYGIGILPTHHLTTGAVHPHPYYPAACSYPGMDVTAPPPPYEECVKQPVKSDIKE